MGRGGMRMGPTSESVSASPAAMLTRARARSRGPLAEPAGGYMYPLVRVVKESDVGWSGCSQFWPSARYRRVISSCELPQR